MKLIHNVYPMPLINITWRNRNTNLKPMVIERSLLRLHSYGMNCLSIWRIQIQSNNLNLASIASHLALNSLPCHFWSRTISSSCSSWDFLRCALIFFAGTSPMSVSNDGCGSMTVLTPQHILQHLSPTTDGPVPQSVLQISEPSPLWDLDSYTDLATLTSTDLFSLHWPHPSSSFPSGEI